MLTPLRRPLSRPWTIRGTPNTSSIADDRLRQAAENFFVFKKKLRELNANLRTMHADTKALGSSRAKVVQLMSELAVESPIVGLVSAPNPAAADNAQNKDDVCRILLVDEGVKENQNDNAGLTNDDQQQPQQCELPTTSYQEVHANSESRLANVEHCQREMIEYAAQWDQCVTSRICAELRHVKKLQAAWVSYEVKVESLKAAVAKKQRKEKQVDLAKVTRNETKLRRAKKEYRNNLICTTLLVEEITLRGWKDLVPLMMKMLQNDVDVAKEYASQLDSLATLQDEVRAVCSRFDMPEEGVRNGRLRLLLEEDATDFARPEDMEDIGTIEAYTVCPTIGSISSTDEAPSAAVHPVDSGKSSPRNSSVIDDDDEERTATLNNTAATDDNTSPNKREQEGIQPSPAAPSATENEDLAKQEDEKGRRKNMIGGYLPSSFYIVYDAENDDGHDDDLTTLTPYTRCERRISI